jgi:hypothetical protein
MSLITNNIQTFFYYCHFTVPFGVVIMPLLPNNILIYVFPTPLLLDFIWLYFGGCPITQISQKKQDPKDEEPGFILQLMQKYVNKNLKAHDNTIIINIIKTCSIIISSYKLLYFCN